ncbi:MAG: ribulose 1,5-bisphosphate carboxylase large subunit [Gracilimonas sp.]|uniref:RuBisCO large subunit C-terminal-like domain-containing protein n=1 Tax=Gracilimonas sp. TaxID=1974203 RepID=UPI00198313F9|nr:RuBisCO large subunit C-terminal-like domain-containing protein [Gracilimonas sp.]MBD3616489.1 ribulose 1,5-bisphosphate carboxylase large subunit [Gracilimonas sp.]
METFTVRYLVTCYEDEKIDEKLRWICLEQSVELPEDVVSRKILDKVAGTVTEVSSFSPGRYEAVIEWPLDNAGNDLTQFLNILYGNISLKRGIKIISVDWGNLNSLFKGAKFGIEGIREAFGIRKRPMACGVLKPMGFSANELAAQACEFALGGIDMIKDDHGLTNQPYAPFEERVSKVVKVLGQAVNETGNLTRYFPNITTSGSRLMEHYELAADLGADGVLVCPHLSGYEAMHELAQSKLDLPIIAHPAFSGTLVTDPEHGFTPAFLYGELYRAFGADFAVYPNTGGRFSFTPKECHELNEAARNMEKSFKPIFPMPGGGMKRETIPQWMREYGEDTVFLLGANMLQHPEGIRKAAEELQEILEG